MKAVVKYSNESGEIRNLESTQENGKVIFKVKNSKRMYLSADGIKVAIEYDNGVGEVLSFEEGLLFCEDAIVGMVLGFFDERLIAYYEDYKVEIRCIGGYKNGRVLYSAKGIETVYLNTIRTKAIFKHRNGKKEIIDLESGRVILEGFYNEEIIFNEAGTNVGIYGDEWIGVINLKSRKIVSVKRKNIDRIDLDLTNTKVILEYKNSVGKIINLENGEILLNEDDLIAIDTVDSRLAKG